MNYGLYVSGQHINDVYLGICRRLWRENTKENPVDWVALPCVNENFEVICNNFGIKEYTDMQGNKKRMPAINDLENINLSAQPYLVPMIERIFAHLGYPVVENCSQTAVCQWIIFDSYPFLIRRIYSKFVGHLPYSEADLPAVGQCL